MPIQEQLFDDENTIYSFNQISTEGIKYAGSKKKIIPYILAIVELLDAEDVFDAFAGTTRVSQALSKLGYRVIANDKAIWSKVFAQCYLLNNRERSYFQEKINYLNHLDGERGWFTKYYGGKSNDGLSVQEDGKKKIWQEHNTMKLDAIRDAIDEISGDDIEKSVYLTSLILALDKVDSAVGHQASYLKEWSKRSYKTMKLEVPDLCPSDLNHEVYHNDIFDIISDVKADIAYYDPPYGSSNEDMPPSRVRYASYYHLWKTICLNDKPEVFGAANRREDSRDQKAGSVFEDFRRDENDRFLVVNALEKLLRKSRSKYIILSYSNKGRATREQITDLLHRMDLEFDIVEVDHDDNVMKSMRSTGDWVQDHQQTKELLFLIANESKSLPSPGEIERITK